MCYCFGCHKGGGAVNFIMEMESVGFVDAVAILAQRAGMEVPDGEGQDTRKRQERLLALNKEAARYFHSNLPRPQAGDAAAYPDTPGAVPKTITNFGMGFALDSWDGLIRAMQEKEGIPRVNCWKPASQWRAGKVVSMTGSAVG